MFYLWKCTQCKKIIRKKAIKIRNVIYIPQSVTHKHNKINYMCIKYNEREFITEFKMGVPKWTTY